MSHQTTLRLKFTSIIAFVLFLVSFASYKHFKPTASAQSVSGPLTSLKTVAIPEPDNLDEFVENKEAAIALGKALFWDMQIGSDGVQACASCHFNAGADSRRKNQLNPGFLTVNSDFSERPDTTIDKGLNYKLKLEDFPFRKLSDPNNRNSQVLADTNDVASSQGVFKTVFNNVIPGNSEEDTTLLTDSIFNVGGVNVRQSPARNTPTVINSVFNFRNFWDGRAQDDFNGVNPFGARDPNAKVVKVNGDTPNSPLIEVQISLNHSSLASQAVGPPTSDVETSAHGRLFFDLGNKLNAGRRRTLFRELGKKMVDRLRPLEKQFVHPDDSVLGAYSRAPRRGLNVGSYHRMIKDAFKPQWWRSRQIVRLEPNGERVFLPRPNRDLLDNEYTLAEYNFALFFGLAVQLYESTLVSDDTPFDRFVEGDATALSAEQQEGLRLFQDRVAVRCINCHGGTEFTNASVRHAGTNRLFRRQGDLIDNGFNNIGVRPTFEDLGVGALDPFGNPLSDTRRAVQGTFFDNALTPALTANEKIGVDGAFKTPGLRNVELTAPYFHNGGQLTLRQVMDFYSRGGDFQPIPSRDGPIQPLTTINLSEASKNALVAFLLGLTDERVRYRRAPFDHPQILIPNGHPGNTNAVINDGTNRAADEFKNIPAVGRHGGAPLPKFLETP